MILSLHVLCSLNSAIVAPACVIIRSFATHLVCIRSATLQLMPSARVRRRELMTELSRRAPYPYALHTNQSRTLCTAPRISSCVEHTNDCRSVLCRPDECNIHPCAFARDDSFARTRQMSSLNAENNCVRAWRRHVCALQAYKHTHMMYEQSVDRSANDVLCSVCLYVHFASHNTGKSADINMHIQATRCRHMTRPAEIAKCTANH